MIQTIIGIAIMVFAFLYLILSSFNRARKQKDPLKMYLVYEGFFIGSKDKGKMALAIILVFVGLLIVVMR